MPEAYITSKDELEETVNKAVQSILGKELPKILRKAKRKEWMSVEDLAELTGWSRRKIYHLKAKGDLPYTQKNQGRIFFPTDGVEEYFRENEITPESDK